MTIDFLKSTLLGAGEILRNGFGTALTIETKQDQSNVVTESDFKSEEYIRNAIRTTYPQHNILGEEHGYEDHGSEYTWIIDPLDGTSNFAAAIPWFGVLIALLKDNQPVLAGAYLPMTDEVYLAEKGKGATKNGKPIHPLPSTDLKQVLCCYSLDFQEDSSKTDREVQIIKRLVQNCRNLRTTNCLIDFCYVAEGKLGATINQSMKVWDIAAPHLILEEVGAKVSDANGGEIQYHPSSASLTENYTGVAASPILHDQIMKLINQTG